MRRSRQHMKFTREHTIKDLDIARHVTLDIRHTVELNACMLIIYVIISHRHISMII